MSIQIYDTLSRKKSPLETVEPGVVRLYVCGVTVYDRSHTGHAMSALVFDMVRRYLEYRGYKVRHVVNFTDVDDKIIKRSQEEGVSAFEIADRYAREYLLDSERMGVLPASIYPRVSSEMPAIIGMIQRLVDQEQAYVAPNGDVYYDSRTFGNYGALSGRSFEEAESQEPPSPHKQAACDFALWKSAKPGEPAWQAPWGSGRPGWHIECSAMALRHLGEQIDIHGGGNDLIFPHHENEIAQSEAACGCSPFARFWMHNGMLKFPDGGSGTAKAEKMSKSLGNVVPIGDFLDDVEAEVFRFFVLSSHYRKPVTMVDEAIEAAAQGLARLRGAMAAARPGSPDEAAAAALGQATETAREHFIAEMDDDFGTPGALAALFDLAKAINRGRDAGLDEAALAAAQAVIAELAGVLGFDLVAGHQPGSDEGGGAVGGLIELLLELRAGARAEKRWAESDRIRDRLAELGVEVLDGKGGSEWRWA